NCHGKTGAGDGFLYNSKKFKAKPTSLVDAYVQGKPDGELYHIIAMGSLSGLMGPHGGQITAENRWMIINYLRSMAK
ncbi:MAG: cytochrome c, partial [Bacteroidota bacterium]|nr:cytochrome c [Bacteroidota bacterium]